MSVAVPRAPCGLLQPRSIWRSLDEFTTAHMTARRVRRVEDWRRTHCTRTGAQLSAMRSRPTIGSLRSQPPSSGWIGKIWFESLLFGSAVRPGGRMSTVEQTNLLRKSATTIQAHARGKVARQKFLSCCPVRATDGSTPCTLHTHRPTMIPVAGVLQHDRHADVGRRNMQPQAVQAVRA